MQSVHRMKIEAYRCNKSNINNNKQNQSKLRLIRNIPFYIILQFISSWFYIIIIYEKMCYINKKNIQQYFVIYSPNIDIFLVRTLLSPPPPPMQLFINFYSLSTHFLFTTRILDRNDKQILQKQLINKFPFVLKLLLCVILI